MARWFFILGMLVFSSLRAAPYIMVLEIDGVLQRDGKGCYNPILSSFLKEIPEISGTRLGYYPPPRVAKMFFRAGANCVFPLGEEAAEIYGWNLAKLSLSKQFNEVGVFLLEEKKNQRKLSVQEIAKNPNIEIAANRDLGNLFEDWTAKVYFVNRHEQLFDMLQFGRVEYIAVVFPDALKLFNTYSNKIRILDPIVISSERLACKKSTDPTYINSFNGMIDRMRKNQQLQKLLGDCYFDSSQLE